MMKSEYARQQLEEHLTAAAGPVHIYQLINRAYLFDPEDGDPRWLGAAVSHFDSVGKLRHPNCSANHYHDNNCTVEWVLA